MILWGRLFSPEMGEVHAILREMDKRLDPLQNRKEKLERVKKGLMSDLLTGKIRVTNLISKEDFHERA